MENHPIPQDVTGFQFRLIGSMTIKQFAYVGAGAILAIIAFYAPIHILIKLILVPLFGGTGALFAFVPIEGRPLDAMAGNFLKALFTPNQYLYHKTGRSLALASQSQKTIAQKPPVQQADQHAKREEQLSSYLSHIKTTTEGGLDQREDAYLKKLFSTSTPAAASITPSVQTPVQPPIAPAPASPIQTATPIPTPAPVQAQPAMPAPQPVQPPPQPEDHEAKFAAILAEKKRLEEELARLTAQPSPTPKPAPEPKTKITKQDLTAPPIYKAKAPITATLPDIPNLLLGTVRDARGNVLPGILVEVRDPEGNPVRAFKTNLLGQFASATALLNGSYVIAFEDPKAQHKFNTIPLTVNGSVIPQVDVVSIDAREELRQSLFA